MTLNKVNGTQQSGTVDASPLVQNNGISIRPKKADRFAHKGENCSFTNQCPTAAGISRASRRFAQAAVAPSSEEPPHWVTKLIDALQHGNEERRRSAARHLRPYGPAGKAAIPALTVALEDKDDYVRAYAALALSTIDPTSQDAVRSLIAHLLAHFAEGVRKEAAEALGDMGPAAKNAVPALIAALKDEHHEVRDAALAALGKIGPAAKEAVPAILQVRAWELKLKSLAKIGPAAVPALIAALDGDDAQTALKALSMMGPDAKDAVPALVAGITKYDDAVDVLVRIGPAAISVLLATLKKPDENWEKRSQASKTLGKIGGPAVPLLVAALKEGDQYVRRLAAEALVYAGSDAVPALNTLLQDKNPRERIAAAKILGDAHLFTPALITAMKDPEPEVRLAVVRALNKGSDTSQDALSAIIEALKDKKLEVRLAAIDALKGTGFSCEDLLSALTKALRDPEWKVRWKAAEAVGKLGPAANDAIPALVAARNDENSVVRYAAKVALAKISEEPSPVQERVRSRVRSSRSGSVHIHGGMIDDDDD